MIDTVRHWWDKGVGCFAIVLWIIVLLYGLWPEYYHWRYGKKPQDED